SEEWHSGVEALKARHGALMDELSRMKDFHLFSF
ncbi:hypothetical protein AAUPMC_03329, partial [Pasteurella multocida subsp. multocida str. Anand1_cattle]